MEDKIRSQLEQARALHYRFQYHEAYQLLRRVYDRLPFQPRREHGEFIGIFIRVLMELGKERELKFYRRETERLYEKTREPALGFQLGMLYVYGDNPSPSQARSVFQSIAGNAKAGHFQVRAKVMLILQYESHGDFGECRRILDTVEDPKEDLSLSRVVRIWRANIGRKEGRLDESERYVVSVLSECTFESDWYCYLSAKIEEAKIAFSRGDEGRRLRITRELKHLLKKKRCRMIHYQVKMMEEFFAPKERFEALRLYRDEIAPVLVYGKKKTQLRGNTISERLILLLLRDGSLDKGSIIQKIYSRSYEPGRDDKTVHYQIHSLRRRLEEIGLPFTAIRYQSDGYRLVAPVEISGEGL